MPLYFAEKPYYAKTAVTTNDFAKQGPVQTQNGRRPLLSIGF